MKLTEEELAAMPPAVRKLARENETAVEEIQRSKEAPVPDGPKPPEPETPTETVPETPPEPVAESPTPTEPAQVPVEDPNSETWKSRFQTLQGKYDAEVPRLQAEIARIHSIMERQASLLDRQGPAPSTADAPADGAPAKPGRRFATDEEAAAFGEELVNFSDGLASKAVAPVQADVKQLREQLAAVRRQTFLSEIARLVPNWRQVNVDPAFLAWLREPLTRAELLDWPNDNMPRLGTVRDEALLAAQETGDPNIVALLFNGFLKVTKAPGSPGRTPLPPPPETHLAQAPSQRGQPPAPRQGKTWKASEIQKFFQDVTRKVYDAKPAERARIEKEIDAALREGRVIQG